MMTDFVGAFSILIGSFLAERILTGRILGSRRLLAGIVAGCVLGGGLLGGGAVPRVFAQERPSQPRIGIPIVLTDDAGGRQVLEVGIDPSATDGVDADFGEERAPLPPPEPTNVFATLVDDNIEGLDQLPGTGTRIDIRQGQEGFAGKKNYEISLDFSLDVINQITFRWDLPAGVTGTLTVPSGEFEMDDSGSATIEGEDLETTGPFGDPVPISRADVTLDYDGSQKQTHRTTIPGTDGTDNDAGWRLLAPPTGAVRGDLQDDLSFEVDSGHLLHTWAGGGPDAWDPATSASDRLSRGEGFILYFFDDEIDEIPGSGLPLDLSSEGEGQSQDVTVNLDTNHRFHVLGNPYDVPFGLGALAGGDLPGKGFQGVVQVWNPDQQQFEPRMQGGGNGPIDSWEGFVVERSTPGQGPSSIAFSASGKQPGAGTANGKGAVVASKSGAAGSEAGGQRAAVRLDVSAGGAGSAGRASVTAFLGEEATAGWDGYDATRIAPPGEAATAASLPAERDGKVVHRVMGSEPYPGEGEARSVPLSVKAAAGQSATVRWPEAAREQVPGSWAVELEDRKTGVRTDLRGGAYSFTVAEGRGDFSGPGGTRFVLHVGPATAVPVEMAGLEASAEGEAVRLTWQTASEQNNAGFYVQRRTGERSWQRLGFVESKASGGTTSEPKRYRFRDAELPYTANRLEYRLRQVDTDGTAHLTGAVTLALGAPGAAELKPPVPNPARQRATLRFAVPEAGEVTIKAYDLLGRQVATVADGRREAGRHERQMDLTGLPSGTYFLRLQVGEEVRSRKLTVLR